MHCIIPILWIKYRLPVKYFADVYASDLCQQGDVICFRYNKTRQFDTLERQTTVGTFAMASFCKKTCFITVNTLRKNINVQLFLQVRN